MSAERAGFLPHIQALRALAVALVVVYHLWPERLSGGYIGVDVFFVISGFLITSHLRREVEARGTVSLPAFYARRARRLLPAALTVVAVTAVGVIALMPVTRWSDMLREAGASAFYVENWALVLRAADYLALDASPSPFQHFWSLSVEEQFYLVWPLLVLISAVVAAKLRARRGLVTALVLGAVVIASLVYAQFVTIDDPSLAYFSTLARAFEFGAGAMLAFLPATLRLPGPLAALLSWGGLAGLVAMSFLYSGATPFPGVAAVGVVVASAAMLVAGRPAVAWGPGWLMERRPVQWLGDVSYSVYLWHWPLIVLVPYALDDSLDWPVKLGILVATLVLAELSRRFIEDPVRRMPRLTGARPRRTLLLTATAMVLVAGLAVAGTLAGRVIIQRYTASDGDADTGVIGVGGYPTREGALKPSPLGAADDVERNRDCWSPETTDRVVVCDYGSKNAEFRVALVGDSHAEQLSGAIVALAKENGWYLETYLKQACSWGGGPMLKPGENFARNCRAYRAQLADELLERDYDAIITTAAVYRVAPGTSAADFRRAWEPVVAAGTALYVIPDNPRWPKDPVDCLVRRLDDPERCDIAREKAFPFPDPLVEAADGMRGVGVVDLTDLYCDADTCYASREGYTIMRDNDHLTRTYARAIGPVIGARLEAAGFPGAPR